MQENGLMAIQIVHRKPRPDTVKFKDIAVGAAFTAEKEFPYIKIDPDRAFVIHCDDSRFASSHAIIQPEIECSLIDMKIEWCLSSTI